ncbi:hypothetical protein MCEMSEM29_01359 [Methylophilaceae bacterium]
MRILEITSTIIKPLTPQQARVSALKQQKERAGEMLKAEKDRQKQQQERDKITNAQQALAKIK